LDVEVGHRPNKTIKTNAKEGAKQNSRWRIVAGGDPGYLPSTPMRSRPIGWFIVCEGCAVEFESKGWKYCPSCMAIPADARRAESDVGVPSNRLATPQNAQKTQCLIGPQDWPINIIGGRRLPQEKPSPLGRVYLRLWR